MQVIRLYRPFQFQHIKNVKCKMQTYVFQEGHQITHFHVYFCILVSLILNYAVVIEIAFI